MQTEPQEENLRNPLELYDLQAEPAKWAKCLDVQKPHLYGIPGLEQGIAYLDSVLNRECGEATREEYQRQRDNFQLALDEKRAARYTNGND